MPNPVIFRISNEEIGRFSHCGVLQFSAQDDAAFLPRWMIENLLLSDGATIKLSLVELPKLTFVKFQPAEFTFTRIENPKAALEEALHRFTCLTRGDVIVVRHHHQEYTLHIKAVLPDTSGEPPAGCVINTNLSVDFDPPVESEPTEEPIASLESGVPVSLSLEANAPKYLRIKVDDPDSAVKFELKCTNDSNPDVYVSTENSKPAPTQHSWAGSARDNLVVQPNVESPVSWYYICAHSYAKPSTCILTVTEIEPAPQLQHLNADSGQTMGQVGSNDPNSVLCTNCKRYVPSSSYQMHSIVCMRNNWACQICGKVMPKASRTLHSHCPECDKIVAEEDMEKHLFLFHAPIKCPKCGKLVEAMKLPQHESEDCAFRLQKCKFCGTEVPTNQIWNHEDQCGGKSVPCEICSKLVARRRMDVHLATVHGVNPCLSPGGRRRSKAAQSTIPRLDDLDAYSPLTGTPAPHEIVASSLAAPLSPSIEDILRRSQIEAAAREDELLARVLEESRADARLSVNRTSQTAGAVMESQPARNYDSEIDAAIAASLADSQSDGDVEMLDDTDWDEEKVDDDDSA